MMKLFKKLLAPLGLIVIINILFLYYLYSLSNKPRQEDALSSPVAVESSDINQQEELVREPAQDISSLISQGEGSNTKDISSSESEEKIKSLIADLESDDLQISQEAADKLTALGKEAVPLLCQGLEGSDTPLKGQIVFILGRIGDKEAIPALLSTIKDENAYIRRNSAEALGKIKDEQAVFELSLTLFDKDISARQKAAWALGELNHPYGVNSLLDKIQDEKETRVKTAIVNSLGKLKDNRAVGILLYELKTHGDQLYKDALINSLTEIKDTRALPAIIEYTDMLKKDRPAESMLMLQWEKSINIAENAIIIMRNNP